MKIMTANEAFCLSHSFSQRNKQAFRNVLADLDLSEIYSQQTTQSLLSLCQAMIMDTYNKSFSKRKIKIRYHNRKPWLIDALKQSIRTKNKLDMKYLKIKSTYNECKLKIYLNHLTRVLKCAEKIHYAALLEANKSNLKKTWNILKAIVTKKKGMESMKNLNYQTIL